MTFFKKIPFTLTDSAVSFVWCVAAGVPAADGAPEGPDGERVPEAELAQVCGDATAARGGEESALPAGEGGETGRGEKRPSVEFWSLG